MKSFFTFALVVTSFAPSYAMLALLEETVETQINMVIEPALNQAIQTIEAQIIADAQQEVVNLENNAITSIENTIEEKI